MDTAELIKHCRISAGYTRRQLAAHVGVTEQSVINWETRRCCPKADTLLAVLRATGFEFAVRREI